MAKATILAVLSSCLSMTLLSQRPPDGIYMEVESFLGQKPDYLFEELSGDWYVSREDDHARARFFARPESLRIYPVIVCLDKDCYLNDSGRSEEDTGYFSRMIEIGPICLYRAQRTYKESIPVKAYNPVNGHPFLESTIQRERTVQVLTMWRPQTGEWQILDRQSFEHWTGQSTDPQAREGELIRGIRSYNRLVESQNDLNERP
ncbi:MAG: hypothetical protein J5I41_00135 [Saprospiraceae bacterium]|nr:hypothetical protein [Saprospiraceae bacterium]